MEITKEQVLELKYTLHKERVDYLLNEWFPEAFRTELEIGKWYKVVNNGGLIHNNQKERCEIGDLFFLIETDKEKIKDLEIFKEHSCRVLFYDRYCIGYGVDGNTLLFGNGEGIRENYLIPATEAEVEAALEAETIKRYGEDWRNVKIKECVFHGNTKYLNSGTFISQVHRGQVWGKNSCLFKDGIWAEILPEEKTVISKEKALKIVAKKLKISPENLEIK